uniref:Integrase catalytic domain-containing protein n=1 Tax=Phytophthora ramorum TaxID=164328 RepID=H3GPF5_PHYRM
MWGNRYVIAAVEYTTRYAVAAAVPEHTAKAIARFLMDKVVLVYGPMRLVERFHRTWKDMVSLYVNEAQDDWDDFLPSALYAYNGSRHATHGYQPNELMMGRKLRTPAELLRRNRLEHPHSTLQDYHEVLLQDLRKARELAAVALQKEQARQAMYYNQRNCMTRNAPVDIVEGFGGGTNKVLRVWRFAGTTQYQQRIVVDALLVDGQGDELLIGEDWMVEHQVKIDFGARELKFRDANGQKFILPFTCHGMSTLQQLGQERKTVVRLARTTKLAANTRSTLYLQVNAEDGSTGIFVPKPSSKRHLLIAPTVDTVKDGMVRVVVMNVEGRREKQPAREALGIWIPTDDDMQILSMNGELERAQVAKWVAELKKDDTRPLADENELDIGEMEDHDRD